MSILTSVIVIRPINYFALLVKAILFIYSLCRRLQPITDLDDLIAIGWKAKGNAIVADGEIFKDILCAIQEEALLTRNEQRRDNVVVE